MTARTRRQRTTPSSYSIPVSRHTADSANQTPAVGDQAFIRSTYTGQTPDGAREWRVTGVSATGRVVTITAVTDSSVTSRMTRRYDGTFRYSSTDYVTFTNSRDLTAR